MTNPISVFSAAREICLLGDWKVTNLALQKILYITEMFFIGRTNGQRFIRENFEAWDFGPVVPELYHKVKVFGANPVQDIFFLAPSISDSGRKDIIKEACDALLMARPSRLVSLTHDKDGAWSKCYRSDVKGIVIPPSLILEEYRFRGQASAKGEAKGKGKAEATSAAAV